MHGQADLNSSSRLCRQSLLLPVRLPVSSAVFLDSSFPFRWLSLMPTMSRRRLARKQSSFIPWSFRVEDKSRLVRPSQRMPCKISQGRENSRQSLFGYRHTAKDPDLCGWPIVKQQRVVQGALPEGETQLRWFCAGLQDVNGSYVATKYSDKISPEMITMEYSSLVFSLMGARRRATTINISQ